MSQADLILKMVGGFFRPQHPAYLIFFVTSRCNCGCTMCFNKENVQSASRSKEMSLPEIEKIARSCNTLPQLLLSGGEPFLRQDVADIVSLFYRYAGTRQFSIPTNATLARQTYSSVERMLEECPNAFFNINLSLDALGEKHDESRALKGCFERLHETYERLNILRGRYNRLSVNFLTVIKSDNAGDAKDIFEYVRSNFKANYHMFGTVRGQVDETQKEFDVERINELLNQIYQHKSTFDRLPLFGRVAPAVARVVRKTLVEAESSRQRNFHCLAGRKMVVVTPEGMLMPCEPLWLETSVRKGRGRDEFVLADLAEFDYDIKAALNSGQAKKINSFIDKRRCACTYGCAVFNSIIYCPRMYPKILKELLYPVHLRPL